MTEKALFEKMENYLDSKDIGHGGAGDIHNDGVRFDWISSEISYYEMERFQTKFNMGIDGYGWSDDGKRLTQVDFYPESEL